MIKALFSLSLLVATAHAAVDNAALPEAIRVPPGQTLRLETVGVGELTWECRAKADAAGQFEWVFVSPVAKLLDLKGRQIGRYYARPTWEALDGSRVTGKQLAVAPSPNPKSIPLQLVQVAPTDDGALAGTTYIQRLNTKGGTPADRICSAEHVNAKAVIAYEAGYAFYGK